MMKRTALLVPAAALGTALLAAPASAATHTGPAFDHHPAHAQVRTNVTDLGCLETTVVIRRTRQVTYFGDSTWFAGPWRQWRVVSITGATVC